MNRLLLLVPSLFLSCINLAQVADTLKNVNRIPFDKIIICNDEIFRFIPFDEKVSSNYQQYLLIKEADLLTKGTDTLISSVSLNECEYSLHPISWDIINGYYVNTSVSCDNHNHAKFRLNKLDIDKYLKSPADYAPGIAFFRLTFTRKCNGICRYCSWKGQS